MDLSFLTSWLSANPSVGPWLAAVGGSLFVVFLAWTIVRGRSQRSDDDALLYGPRTPAAPGPEEHVLRGGFEQLPLPDLLQYLASSRRTGTLLISSGRRSGTIRMVQGMVASAEYRRSVDLDALFEMLSMQIGDFVFRPEQDPGDEAVSGREVLDILMLWLSRTGQEQEERS